MYENKLIYMLLNDLIDKNETFSVNIVAERNFEYSLPSGEKSEHFPIDLKLESQ